ncbi:MAG: ECF transporter S component [Coriobacteriales bacterium]|nr:ECF transporter S component [Coriobacteriales bacterium]
MSAAIQNTNKWDTKTMVAMALLAAIAALLSFIEGGNFGGFLDYDASFVPAVIGGFIYGPVPGVIIGLVSWLIHGLIKADFWGTIMNMACVIAYVVPAAIIYRRQKTMKSAAIGLVVGSVCAVIVMIFANLIVTPIYTGLPVETVAGMIVPLLLPFNAGKAAVNSILAFILYKPVQNMVLTDKEKDAA